MLRHKPKLPLTGSANHSQAVGEIRDDVNILDDNQVGLTNEIAAMKAQFAALANAVMSLRPTPALSQPALTPPSKPKSPASASLDEAALTDPAKNPHLSFGY